MTEEDIWTVGRMLDWMQGYLQRKGDENPRLSAQWLLSHATGLSRIELYLNLERPLSADERDVLRDGVSRRGDGEPLQYITGEAPFRHLVMKVRSGVLIPRPETEVLVSEALALLPAPERVRSREFLAEMSADLMSEDGPDGIFSDTSGAGTGEKREDMSSGPSPDMDASIGGTLGDKGTEVSSPSDETSVPPSPGFSASTSEIAVESRNVFANGDLQDPDDALLVADIGTGSGCIACSVAYEHPRAHVIATDVSTDALAIAKENAQANGLEERIDFFEGDLGAAVPPEFMGRFDAILSNPPYIPDAVLAAIPREVTGFEPDLALAGGADGLDAFRRLLPWAFEALDQDGFFACELHEESLDEAAALAERAGFAESRIAFDLAGKPRVLIALKERTSRREEPDGE